MPYAIKANKRKGFYTVYNKDTGKIYAYHATRENAYGQMAILNRLKK